MNQIISRINLFVKNWSLIKMDNFAYVQTCPTGVQYLQIEESEECEQGDDCCGNEEDTCCGNCNCA